jgi:hypothetical protein
VASELVRHALAQAIQGQNGKGKAARALQLIAESQARKLELMEGLTPGRCGQCNGLAFMYQPPAIMQWKCRTCRAWNRIVDAAGMSEP